MYYICNNFDDDYDVDGYDYFDDNVDSYDYFDDDYGDYDYYYCDDYNDDYDYYYCKHDDDDYDNDYYYYDDDDDYKLVYYKMPLNYFERLVSVKNNIVNGTSNDDYSPNITLIINNCKIDIS